MSSQSSSSSTPDANRKRERIFLDSSNPSMPNQVFDSISPSFIKIPFPPCIDPYKLILDRNKGNNMDRTPIRTPNAFIIYRKLFIECARKEGYRLPMTVISSMASKSWKHESDIVKEEYKRISKQVFEIKNQLYPKSDRKKKKDKWNFVSFSKKSNLSELEMKISSDHNKDINPNLETTNLFSSEQSSNIINQDIPYIKEKSSYNQTPVSYTNYSYISNNSNNNNIGFGINEILDHNVINTYVDDTTDQHDNNTYVNSINSTSALMQNSQNSHFNFQPYHM
ncbi:hypothetical protein C1645_497869 [Glomus cerebriforme]|uniref:HMG box domain-containing protein n=1 Tax=Glomus cerebriforme TaxID=658196 RepID=A0A397SIK6_9GLOM|nr:hypothetical protein C1645_497869 [Glomus cerebriforme]